MAKRKKKKKNKRHIPVLKYLLVSLLMLLSVGLMTYPFISNYIYENQADGIVEAVEKSADEASAGEYDEDIRKAQEYNYSIAEGRIQLKDPFDAEALEQDKAEYATMMNMTEDGIMGFVKIPCIDVSLPIYHGTSDEVLEKGAGHLQGSSLPIGGTSTHSIITGHTGLSRAKMFTDLSELEEGDLFFLHVMGEKLAYKVDKIDVVLPYDINDFLGIDKGEDYCTLLTCTPYGVNSHRLLVRGTRIDYEEAEEEASTTVVKKTESKWMIEYVKSIMMSSIAFIICMILLLIYRAVMSARQKKKLEKQAAKNRKKKKRKKKKKKTNSQR